MQLDSRQTVSGKSGAIHTCVKLLNTVEFGGAEEFHFQCTEYDKEVFFSNSGASIRDFRYAVKVGISGVVNSV